VNKLPNLEDFIVIANNVISHDVCDMLLNEYHKDETLSYLAIGKGEIDLDMRKVNGLCISEKETIEKNIDYRKELDNHVFNAASCCIKTYQKKFKKFQPSKDTGYDFLKYDVGDFYAQHVDSFADLPRMVSCSISLNDDFVGGEFGFFDRKIITKAPKGSAIMFPSNFMYPHEILPITQGTRYSIITWFL